MKSMLRETINKFLSQVENEDQHIRASIIKRRKDNPEMDSEAQIIKRYTFETIKDYDRYAGDIEYICKMQNARFYVNPTVKSYKTIAFKVLSAMVNHIGNENYERVKTTYDSVADSDTGIHSKRFWVVDLDDGEGDWRIDDVVKIYKEDGLYITHTKTKNGYHVVVRPYDNRKDTLSIKKNAYVLLYWPELPYLLKNIET